jgi:phage terminase large subunit
MREFKVLQAYADLFYSDKTYFLISGGRSSGKSTQVAAYFVIKLFSDEFFRGVISRYSAKSVKMSIYQDILDVLKDWNLLDRVQIAGQEIINPVNDNRIITHSFRIPDATMSAKGKGLARVTHLIIDEATELPSEEEYIKVQDSFRVKGVERKIFIVFNPTSKLHWIHKRWFIDGKPNPKWFIDHCFIHTTYRDNANNIDHTKMEEWERMKTLDSEYYSHHILGEWRDAYIGKIFKDWHFDYNPPHDAEITYGLDFGFSSDPAACIEVKRKGNQIWIREILYSTGLTNDDLYSELNRKGIDERSTVIADSAEPKSIEDLRKMGLRRIVGAKKGAGSVIRGIKLISSLEVHCDSRSQNLIDEYNSYVWKVGTDIPQDKNNHIIDALRYALSQETPTGVYRSTSSASYKRQRELQDEMDRYG